MVRAGSGFYATYTLTAFRGINVSTEPVKLYTLGTPILTFDNENPKYDNISVTWNPVNKVDSYELSYSVDNGTSYTSPIEIPASTTELENLTINADESFTYKFVQPTNYDDATFSGKDILVKIQAKNTLNSTTNNVPSDVTLFALLQLTATLPSLFSASSSRLDTKFPSDNTSPFSIATGVRYELS